MVAIVTGAGLGLQRDSASVLGSQGQIGQATLGEGGEQVTVNAANGNLVIQSTDEMLIGVGLDDNITNTYNSQSTLTANAWQESFQRHPGSLGGTVNTSGSTIKRYGADGTTTTYTYDISRGLYVGNEAGSAYDTLSFNSATNQWTWQDGKTRVVEVYDGANNNRLVSVTDADGNALSYTYTGSHLTKITMANGDYTSLIYTGSLLTSVVTSYTDSTGLHSLTRVRYGYDASNRLTNVTVDLSPKDNSIADNNVYVTTYGYDGTSNRIASITQSDGSNLQIAYTLVGSIYAVSSLSRTPAPGAAAETTTFSYGTGRTTVTDSQGNATTLLYDNSSRLIQLCSPPAASGGAAQWQAFTYDAYGNLLFSGPAGDPNFTNIGTYWNDLTISDGTVTTTQSTEVDGGVAVYRRQTTTTPTSGVTMRLGTAGGRIAVIPGQTIQFSVYAASSGVSNLKLYAMWRDTGGTSITNSTVATITTGGTLGASGLATAKFASGSSTASAGAAFVEFMVQGTADGTGPMNVAIAQPLAVVTGGTLPPSFTYTYDANGNCLSKTDSLGSKTTYVYDSSNQLLTKTTYADGTTPQTTRYVYDAENHLTYVLSPSGEVTQYVYNAAGQQTSAIQYTSAADIYDVSSLATTASPTLATMNAWAATGRSLTTTQRTDTTYDMRGLIASVKTYQQTASDGSGAAPATTITYVYDQAGQLLQRQLSDGTEFYLYDGLFRITSNTDAYGKATQTSYSKWLAADGTTVNGAQVVVTLANGTTETSFYDQVGELTSYVVTGGTAASGGIVTATTNYVYDSNGNLIRTVDPTGIASYSVYDGRNRKVADIAPDGAITAYVYNANDQIISTVSYANKLSSSQLTNLGNEAAYTTTPLTLSSVTPTPSSGDRRSWNIYDGQHQQANRLFLPVCFRTVL